MSAAFEARLRRLLILIPYLSKHGEKGVPVEEAAEFAGCRDIDELTADVELLHQFELPFGETLEYLDIEIENGRVTLQGPAKFREPPRLTVDEGAALLAAVQMLGEALGKPMDAAVRKVRRALPPGAEDQVERLARTEHIAARPAPRCKEALEDAAERRLEVALDYFSAVRAQAKQYTVEPRAVRLQRGEWYLVAWDVFAGQEKLFRLDRIRDLKVGPRRFEAHKGPADPWEERGATYVANGAERPVEIHFSAKVAQLVKSRWEKDATEHPDGSMTVRANMTITPYLAAWVLGYGGEAVIVSPPEAVGLFEKGLRELAAVYGG